MDMGFQATMRAVAEISYNTNYPNATRVNTSSWVKAYKTGRSAELDEGFESGCGDEEEQF